MKIYPFSDPAFFVLAAFLFTGQVHATPVPIELYNNGSMNFITSSVSKSSSKDVATVLGYDGDIVDGTYKGAASAFTLTEASSAFYASEAAGTKVTWWAFLTIDSQNHPVDLYLDLNTWVTTNESGIALGEVTHGILVDISFKSWLGSIWSSQPFGQYNVRMDNTDSLHTTLFAGSVIASPYLQLALQITFENASGLWFALPGFMSSSAFGYLDFTLRADDPSLPKPIPEPPEIMLFSVGFLGFLGIISRQRKIG